MFVRLRLKTEVFNKINDLQKNLKIYHQIDNDNLNDEDKNYSIGICTIECKNTHNQITTTISI